MATTKAAPGKKGLINFDFLQKLGKVLMTVIAVMPVPDDQVNRFGVIAGSAISDDVWKIDGLVEKPALEDAPSNLAVFGRYLLSARVMELLAEAKPTVGGEIQEVEQDIVERVFNLGDRNVGSIMTHRSELVWLNIDATNDEIEQIVKNNLFNTYPVADRNLDSIAGVVYLKDLFGRLDEEGFSLSKVIRPAQYIPENLSVYNALELMRTTGGRYGIVTDEFGTIDGIVTFKDIIKALVGSMPEAGEEQDIVARDDGSYLIDGQIPFYDFLAFFDQEELYNEFNYNTLSGLILEELEHIPQTGEKLSWRNFNFEIVDMDAARIDKVLVSMKPAANGEPA